MANALACQIAEAEQFLSLPASPDVGTTSSGSAMVIWHDPADLLVAQLHYQAGGVQNIRLLVLAILELESPPTLAGATWSSSPSAAMPLTTMSSLTPRARSRPPRGYASTASSSPRF